MLVETAAKSDRRHVRRAETIDQLIEVAIQVMSEQGAAGLSLGEVARRIGIRPPSLYVYFDSKNAVYDAVFALGWQQVGEALRQVPEPSSRSTLQGALGEAAEAFVRWAIEHPVHAQLMFWRPVPGYQPSADAYAPAVAVLEHAHRRTGRLQELGLLRDDVPVDQVLSAWTVLTSGVISQQLSNAPEQSFENGTFTTLLPALVAMFSAHYGSVRRPSKSRGKR